ncbi:NAD(P)/FAD-dependent oxidoreductase [Streptomyces albireticuli]|uniref:FAD-dependent oxidoreductase n=1 Tax=Streptomyces albireticuli TaxID=1940 RepID=A0A2A2D4X9_9ACTN|nr:FAD-dependent oxidoreductase [Streptomyces albireticuli]MCD9143585.1 FAD-dependent oxidoreductase [Streptomyces albireticuli]MCD9161984.1 FAD-dependent oxidoreductase [Streptomyces albireticuli]MCD9191702.1 FAD-dependent oxidoreductase [Streptomyces albireticuli]PAU46496.1 FAD-dependent oxidoreductase [Streptomyces albireticuli]
MTRTLVIVGHGMIGHRVATDVLARDTAGEWRVTVLAEESRPAYNRVALSTYLGGRAAAALTLARPDFLDDPRLDLRLSTPVAAIDRDSRTVKTADGTAVPYDALVLATGSRPFVPPVPGHDLPGCFVYRTLDDLDAIRAAAEGSEGRPGVVIGGGLLGLEAAGALRKLGMKAHVVEMAPRLMAVQLDQGGGDILARMIRELGVEVHCSAVTEAVEAGPDGSVSGVRLADGTLLETDLVVFSAGIRPRDDLAEQAGLRRAERGGFLVDNRLRTEDDRVWAVGECAAVEGRCYGLATPGYQMAKVVVEQLLDGDDAAGSVFDGADMSTKLKLLGVDVASIGDAHATTPGAIEYVQADPAAGTYAKLVLAEDGRTLLGGVLAGDAKPYPLLRSLLNRELPAPVDQMLAWKP